MWYGWDSIGRAFRFIKEAVAMCFRDKDLILPSLLAVSVNVAILGIALTIAGASGMLESARGDETAEFSYSPYVLFVLLTLLSYFVTYFFMGMTANLVDTHLKQKDARLGVAFADAAKNFLAIVSLAAVSTVVAIVVGALRGKRGATGRNLLAETVDRIWTVATYLLLPIIILEDCGLNTAIGRARNLHRKNLLGIAVGEIAVTLVTGFVAFFGILAAALVGVFVAHVMPGGVYVAVGLAAVLVFLVMAFVMYVRMAYYTCMYVWMAEAQQAGAAVSAPAPLVEALA